MAAVVNAFQSSEVQYAVYERLVDALDEANESGSSERGDESRVEKSDTATAAKTNGKSDKTNSELTEVVEGDSIHSIAAD